MIFQGEHILMIANESKTQTRRLVKDGEFYNSINGKIICVHKNKKTKWQVGKTYSVQHGRGKRGVYWCSKCKEVTFMDFPESSPPICNIGATGKKCLRTYKSFRIRITAIRKEKLLDITNEDAKKEGCKNISNYLSVFGRIYEKKIPNDAIVVPRKGCLELTWDAMKWNPEVWVLDFEVVK